MISLGASARLLAVAILTASSACTAIFGDEEAIDLGVPSDLNVADLSSPADLGFTWTARKLTMPGVGSLYDVWGADTPDGGTVLFAVGEFGAIISSLDEGEIWTSLPSPTTATLRTVWGRTVDDVFAGGDPLPTVTSSNVAVVAHGNRTIGFAREPIVSETGTAHPINAIWSAGPGEKVWATGPCLAISTDGSGTWDNSVEGPCDVAAGLWGTATNDVWLISGSFYPDVFHSTGTLFVPAGIDFTAPNGRIGLWGDGVPGKTSDLWTVGLSSSIDHRSLSGGGWMSEYGVDGGVPLQAIWGRGASDLYAVGGGNTVLHRSASGWVEEPVASATKVTLFSVWGLSSGRVIAVGEFGWVFVRK